MSGLRSSGYVGAECTVRSLGRRVSARSLLLFVSYKCGVYRFSVVFQRRVSRTLRVVVVQVFPWFG